MELRTRAAGCRARLGLCALLSLGALACSSDAPDAPAGSRAGNDQSLGKQPVVTQVAGDPTRATIDLPGTPGAPPIDLPDAGPGARVEAADGGYVVTLPGLPPIVVGGPKEPGPRVIDVSRTHVGGALDAPAGSGPRVVDVTRTDPSQAPAAAAPRGDDQAVVKQGKDETTITVQGFPTITLRHGAGGETTVHVPGIPPFALPEGATIEAPGGIRVER